MNKLFSSNCVCSVVKQQFIPTIIYRNETVFKNYNGLVIAKCQHCGMLKTFSSNNKIKVTPEISEVEHYEENRQDFQNSFEELVNRVKVYIKSGSVLEVGASSGNLMRVFQVQGFDVSGIEPNRPAFNVLTKQFGQRAYYGYLKDFIIKNKVQFDLVIYNHVLEHVENPNNELNLIKQVLKKGGLLIVGVPNCDNIVFKVRRKFWESLLPNQHIWHFSTKHLFALLTSNGFRILNISYNNHKRKDYPLIKKIYFWFLVGFNRLKGSGEAVLVIAIKL
ncbi:MAG: hypothetical protein AUJ28_02705 [Parcubacteria group bacterium CG1_02_37_51]|uniref:Class I SAM-dependent methyltransferase n=1 Tax=Candidatus Roizmanbacteria bacterium CG_4_10_14_0_8_um_filter_39_9 TaxID=1974829 RepID=A0A2M7QDB7_9BACT|nr:MAG: hypothetical protein AUJ28_02705 [Parcubacteria group bacterium CG1_02_37_51]PIY69201.1 MAG: hypothetical protein COY90_01915 [Candidatus Roizmanbacteria bacterium CG_4_10_14_0_8_um_filter_39_9]